MTTSSKPISKILVAIDGSDKSTEASQYAILLAKKNRAKLLALNVINTQPWFYSSTSYGWATPEKMEDLHKRDREEAQIWLERIKEDATNNDVEIHTKILLVPTTQSSTVNAIATTTLAANLCGSGLRDSHYTSPLLHFFGGDVPVDIS